MGFLDSWISGTTGSHRTADNGVCGGCGIAWAASSPELGAGGGGALTCPRRDSPRLDFGWLGGGCG